MTTEDRSDVMDLPVRDAWAGRWGLTRTSGNRWRASISPRWSLPDRVFGGYSAALCCAATLAAEGSEPVEPESRQLLSATIAFLAPVRAGEIEFEVGEVRRGRRVTWLTGIGRQDDRQVISSTLAVAPSGTDPAPASVEPIEPPADLPTLDYLAETWPFAANFDERAVDYPESLEKFCDGSTTIDLWVKALDPVFCGDALSEQVADVAIADAHLLDGVLRSSGTSLTEAFSIDLQVAWAEEPLTTAWRRVQIEGNPSAQYGAARGVVLAADGSVRAWAMQRGMLDV
ncbi:acyl-CoA thioesterase domain-containing protein [Cryptosporangium aurantiacum]|uniref:Acyl-CoA thioesterase n=1 Tax=Cryptosporangium aurantiacum TaxID=134849 RepID=A0A1M7R490_9ACTN|nr:acyl-CoA thioesterase domain-containing protein [Cryptosporangium aurantiacum]SHN40065.1 Acyl-CoA thioesterase [Cryptosporangium aurantiacum]